MGEIILIVVAISMFIFFIYLFHSMSKKKAVKKDDKKSDVPTAKKDDKKLSDDIPDILKEVTSGNYMYDLSQSSNDEVVFVENENISYDEQDSVKRTNVEKAFDDIGDIGDDLDNLIDIEIEEIEEIEDDLSEDIGDTYNDSVLLGDIAEDSDEKAKGSDIAKEYKELSKNMKAIIIANALERKHKD